MFAYARSVVASAFFFAAACSTGALAQAWPSARPVVITQPLAPGGLLDVTGRLLAAQLQEQLHQNFIMEAKVGGGGVTGTQYVSHQRPDGYSLLLYGDTLSQIKYLNPDLDLDVENDLT